MLGIDPKTARKAWSNAAVYTLVALLLCVIWVTRHSLLVFATAVMFAYLLYPFADMVDRRMSRKSRPVAVAIPFLCIFSLLGLFGWFVRTPLQREYATLSVQVQQRGFEQELVSWSPLGLPAGQRIAELYAHGDITPLIPELGRGMGTTARYFFNLLIIPILSFFILKDGQVLRDGFLDAFGNHRRVENILTDAHALLLEYMRALLLLCLATFIAFTAALSLLRVPYPLLLGLAAFPLEFVPMAGPLASALLIIAVSAFNNYPHIPWVVAFLVAYRIFQDYVLSPHLMKKGVKLHPLLVLLGLFAGAEIGSVPGIFLSVPVLALLRLIYFESRKYRVPVPVLGASADTVSPSEDLSCAELLVISKGDPT